jgi:transposase
VADSARYSEENLRKLGETGIKWITWVPATLSEAQAVLAQADPPTMTPLMAGYCYHQAMSTYGSVPQRWLLVYSEHRRPQAQRMVDKYWRKQRAAEAKAFQQLCRTAYACAADAQHALTTFTHGLPATSLHGGTVHPTPCYRIRGRPSQDTPPARVVYHITGPLASSLAAHEALVAPHSCFILAANELDERTLSAQALLERYKGQQHAERGFRFLKDPRFLASSLYLKKPERIMALLMVMTVCWLVYAALAYRIRQTLKAHQATFPNQKGQPVQNPTARWVFQYFVGIHLLRTPSTTVVINSVAWDHDSESLEQRRTHDVDEGTRGSRGGPGRLHGPGGSRLLAR